MSFQGVRIALAGSIILGFQSAGCKPRTEAAKIASAEGYEGAVEFEKEVIPFNRVPMERMKADEDIYRAKGWRFPAKTEVQTHEGKAYGIRVIDPEDLELFVRPGDIAVDYSTIADLRLLKFEDKVHASGRKAETGDAKENEVDDYVLIVLGEQGMSHAKMVVEDKGKICHIDSPSIMSDCDWDGYQHFFRVDVSEEDAKNAANMAKNLMFHATGDKRIDYDSLLVTDIYTKGFAAIDRVVKKALEDDKVPLPAMYCSELPFVFHSVVAGKPIFTHGYNLIEFVEQIAAFRNVPAFSSFVSNESMQKNLVAFIQQASTVNESMRPILTTGVRQLLADGAVGSSLRFMAKQFYPSVIFPKNYMIAAKDPKSLPGSRIVYIGSIETKTQRRDAQYYSTMISNVSKSVYESYLDQVRRWWNGKDPAADGSMDDQGGADASGDSDEDEGA